MAARWPRAPAPTAKPAAAPQPHRPPAKTVDGASGWRQWGVWPPGPRAAQRLVGQAGLTHLDPRLAEVQPHGQLLAGEHVVKVVLDLRTLRGLSSPSAPSSATAQAALYWRRDGGLPSVFVPQKRFSSDEETDEMSAKEQQSDTGDFLVSGEQLVLP
uniref:Uncharacterized protein n=1 Tax=Trichuris muris TaxID=70415 RepID=A0A5S6QE07_TRIMR